MQNVNKLILDSMSPEEMELLTEFIRETPITLKNIAPLYYIRSRHGISKAQMVDFLKELKEEM